MSNYRNQDIDIFTIKAGWKGRVRLFFYILNHPWGVMRVIDEFRKEQGKLEAELVSLRLELANALNELADARLTIGRVRRKK